MSRRAASFGRRAAATVAALTLTAGCTIVWSEPGARSRPVPGGGLSGSGNVPDAAEANDVVQRALKDVERYWAATYPALADGAAFTPVRGGYHPYTRSDPPPACGPEAGEYQPNAFYCPVGDFIAWDAETLIPQLHADYGQLLVAVVMAHEYGHAVQARLNDTRQPTVVLEQQADCFAGGWVGDVIAGSSSFEAADPAQLDDTVAGLLTLRDQPGTSATSPQAHGNAFDRVRAFQEGVQQSATRCATYRSGNLPVTEVPFSDEREAATGGDLPYEQAVATLSEDAESYWDRTFPQLTGQDWQQVRVVPFASGEPPECSGREAGAGRLADAAFACVAGGFVAFDNERLGPQLHRQIGDNAVGMLIGGLYAQTVHERRGGSTRDRDGQLAVDCLAGSWTHDLLTRGAGDGIRLSPGDLDEAVAALLAFGRAAPDSGATAFDRIAEFRKGVLEGLAACG